MTLADGRILARFLPRLCFSSALLSLLLSILFGANIVSAQSVGPPPLIDTPSTLVLLVGDDYALSVDATGRPVSGAEWTISAPIVSLHVVEGEVYLDAKTPGRATLTATFDGQSASATISILPGSALPQATVRWSLERTPGYETLKVFQAHPSGDSRSLFIPSRGANPQLLLFGRFKVSDNRCG